MQRMRAELPWWVVVATGVACVTIGALLVGQPLRSLGVVVALTAVVLVTIGVGDIVAAHRSPRPWLERALGVMAIVAAAAVAVWPGITVLVLAVALGIVLVARGVTGIIVAWGERGAQRWLSAMSALTSLLVGVIALTWPAVTVLVVAAGFGFAAAIAGVLRIVTGLRMRTAAERPDDRSDTGVGPGPVETGTRRRPSWIRLVGAAAALLLAIGLTVVSVAVNRARPGEPGAFYDTPSPLPDGPAGSVIRSEVVDGFQPGATTYRVLYLSTGLDGAPTAVSGLVIVPDAPAPPGGRRVIGYAHGTVGVASRCSPSLRGERWGDFMRTEGLDAFLDAGYVVAATDYQGLGTKGPHPYLIGAVEGMNELDAVRAARTMPEAEASDAVGLWGHSQGGHAALFAAQLAATYAPELDVVGVAAGAPAPDLVSLFRQNIDSPVGRILIAGALQAWSEVFDEASLSQIVTPAARPVVRELAENCLYSSLQIIGSIPASLALDLTFLSNPPWETEPWATIVLDNDPGNVALDVPVLLTQGAADVIVPPTVTEALLDRLCAGGDVVDLQLLDGIGHIDGGPAAVPLVAAWMADRFDGAAPPDGCG